MDIPKDVTATVTEFVRKEPIVLMRQDLPAPRDIRQVVDLINSTDRPIIYFGGGIISSEASGILADLIHTANIPRQVTPLWEPASLATQTPAILA